jgi:integrase
VNKQLTVLRKLLSVASEWGLIEHVPPVKWVRVPPQKFDFLSFEEAGRLVDAADPEWRAAIVVGLRCAVRLGEIIGLRWEDVDLVAGRLVVNRAVSRGRVGSPKNGRAREVPLGLDVLRALKAHRHLKGELVFPGPNGRLLHRNETKHPLRSRITFRALPSCSVGWSALVRGCGNLAAATPAPLGGFGTTGLMHPSAEHPGGKPSVPALLRYKPALSQGFPGLCWHIG